MPKRTGVDIRISIDKISSLFLFERTNLNIQVQKYKVLVIGSGGREHAIIHQLKKSPILESVFCIPGNAGIKQIATCFDNIKISDHHKIIDFCQQKQIDLVVIGPEQPLIDGLVDILLKNNIKAFGPSKLAARLEGSKAFTKEICDNSSIPTAKYKVFQDSANAKNYLKEIDFPCVIKADGIAAGKGVIIASNPMEADVAIKEIFDGKFGKAGQTLIIEEFLQGVEVSFFAICDGKSAKFLGTAGDHKKVGDGDTGPNTGGMGTYSPSPFIDKNLQEQIMQNFINPTIKAMQKMKCPFAGILFAGLILTKDGPKLLEFNTRFGDPETQSLLSIIKSDLLQMMLDAASGKLSLDEVEFYQKTAVCVIMATNGYPDQYQKGSEIKNLKTAQNHSDDVIIFHSGTKNVEDKIVADGGRVLGVTALADKIFKAREKAYKVVKLINWSDGFYREDIALNISQNQD